MTSLNSRISKLERTPAAIIADGFQQIAPLIDAFKHYHDACFNAWSEALRGYVAEHAPELSYLFAEIERANGLPLAEQEAALKALIKQNKPDCERLDLLFYEQVKAAQRGDIAPLHDCPEYHAFVDYLEQLTSVPTQFKERHGQALASELANRVEQYIEEVIASYELK